MVWLMLPLGSAVGLWLGSALSGDEDEPEYDYGYHDCADRCYGATDRCHNCYDRGPTPTSRAFSVRVDCRHFRPQEVRVSCAENNVVVHCQHREEQDAHGWVEREFKRRYELPDNCPPDTVVATLDRKGMLLIEAGSERPTQAANERQIPVNVLAPIGSVWRAPLHAMEFLNRTGMSAEATLTLGLCVANQESASFPVVGTGGLGSNSTGLGRMLASLPNSFALIRNPSPYRSLRCQTHQKSSAAFVKHV
ncbi:unnamed protein product [Oppiella nova]|uniref:SHSP domain-containing protein n=1 Tax=Oppiella nova TaxID=334625 RepID=A0A7R9LSL7_9ACAR|nr:unnamed protein product [Oppiella nova]CAG2166599.1 unnamed protein product [Oppiella nova]